jgi:tRNA pseudouridine55 synthase
MDGVIIVNKPAGWTSHDVVAKMRGIAKTRRIGHLGTLDPMATGVLPIVIERATRLSQFYTKSDKVYDAVVTFGFATDTYDAEGERVGEEQPYTAIPEEIERLLTPFRGTIQQTPPQVSAKKINGTPAYKLARKKIDVEMKPVEITIYSLDLISCEGPNIRIKVHSSAGTYIRSIAHDLGRAAGVGAHLSALIRTVSSDFTIEESHTLDQLADLAAQDRLREAIIPAAKLLPHFPSEFVDQITAGQIRQGRDFRVSPFRVQPNSQYVKAISPDGDLLAIGEVKLPNLYHPILVM